MLLAHYNPGPAPQRPIHPGKRAHWIRKLWYYYRDLTHSRRWKKWYRGADGKGGYLNSDAWKNPHNGIKAGVLKRDGYRCTQMNVLGIRCSNRENLQVHHTSYKKVGREGVGSRDLKTLCDKCHNKYKGTKLKGQWKWWLSNA